MKKQNDKKDAFKVAALRILGKSYKNGIPQWVATSDLIEKIKAEGIAEIPSERTQLRWLNEMQGEFLIDKSLKNGKAHWSERLEDELQEEQVAQRDSDLDAPQDELDEEREKQLQYEGFEDLDDFEAYCRKIRKVISPISKGQHACMIALRKALYNYDTEPQFSDVGHDDLAKLMGCSERSAERFCDYLEALHLINRDAEESHDKKAIIYITLLGRAYIEVNQISEDSKIPHIFKIKVDKSKKETKVIKLTNKDQRIPKEIIYQIWSDEKVIDVQFYFELVKGRVKKSSIRSWLSMWKNGRGFPRSAKK